MSIKKEEIIQSITISGITVTTASGVVDKGSKAETALKILINQCEKNEEVERIRKISVVLVEEYENPSYAPNINYLWSCLINKPNGIHRLNLLLGLAVSNVRPPKELPDFIHRTVKGFLYILEDIVNG